MNRKWYVLVILAIILGVIFSIILPDQKESVMAVEFDGTQEQSVSFGMLSNIPELQDLSQMSIVAIFKPEATPQALHYINAFYATSGTAESSILAIQDDDTVYFADISYDGAGGAWWETAESLTLGNPVVVIITYDDSNTANDPKIYIDASSATVSEGLAPTGSSLDNITNVEVFFGGPDQDARYPIDGPNYLWAVFNRILTQEEVSAITEQRSVEGYHPVWLVRGMGAAGNQDYDGITLTASDKIIEEINGYEGVPNNSPLGYADDYLHVK